MPKEKITKRIVITGVVQGVGFRPRVYRLAVASGVAGYVQNKSGHVEIVCAGEQSQIDAFIQELRSQSVPFSRIDSFTVTDTHRQNVEQNSDFFVKIDDGKHVRDDPQIVPQVDEGIDPYKWTPTPTLETQRFISPDLPLCPDCSRELADSTNRRFRHFFNTCTACGPRFSVLRSLPYDRCNTSMNGFTMCEACADEYRLPHNRRFHAETISCKNCGPYILYQSRSEHLTDEPAFDACVRDIREGGIVAVKGIGGYHLACLSDDETAVSNLRQIKGRDAKPFAVLFENISQVEEICTVNAAEKALLESSARPIAPLSIKTDAFAPSVLMGDRRCGCFLAYTPLHRLLIQELDPLVMTSANYSGSAILFRDEDMLTFFEQTPQLSGVLYNTREIIRPLEDGVTQIVAGNLTQPIRLGRGQAPLTVKLASCPETKLLALGGDLKASFCLVNGHTAHLSQSFGDLIDETTFLNYQNELLTYRDLFDVSPQLVVCDAHPGYRSTNYADTLGLPVLHVQHHHAHIASVMAEHNLTGSVLGAAFDGTGYGSDEAVWGGEFLLCSSADYKRVGHLTYTKLLGGDALATDAKRTAACYLLGAEIDVGDAALGVPHNTTHQETDIVKAALASDVNCVESSSMGRLFDAVAAILGLSFVNSYEGKCAIVLQRAGEEALSQGITPIEMSFDIVNQDDVLIINYHGILKKAAEAAGQSGIVKKAFALGFHWAVADMTTDVFVLLRDEHNVSQIALSGGVFQNKLLFDRCYAALRDKGFQVYSNNAVPVGDGGIALGQAYIAALRRRVES